MAKIGRNAPCPCGSGKKYKKCCLPLHDQADKERRRLLSEPVTLQALDDEMDDLDELSNRVVDLINEGRLDQAEQACEELRLRYPDQIDWIERQARIYQVRGEKKKAAEWYRKAETFARTHGGFDEEGIVWYKETADRLDLE